MKGRLTAENNDSKKEKHREPKSHFWNVELKCMAVIQTKDFAFEWISKMVALFSSAAPSQVVL